MTTLLLVPGPSQAQSIELAGGVDVPLRQSSFLYDTRYVPPVVAFESSGEAGQTVTLQRSRRPAVWGAVAWFPARHAGVEARAGFRSSTVSGTSGPHHVSLTYTSRQPPDYVPRQFSLQTSTDQPAPGGELRTVCLDVLAIGRFGDARRLEARVSGGLALVAVSGEFEPVALSVFRLGGHSTLFSDDRALTLTVDRKWSIGAVAGFDVFRAFTNRAGFTAGLRVMAPRTIGAPVRVTAVGDGLFSLTVSEAQEMLAPAPLRIRPWTFDLNFGLRLVL